MSLSQTKLHSFAVRLLAVLLALAVVLALTGCGRTASSAASSSAGEADESQMVDDALYVFAGPDTETPLDGGGETIALAVGIEGTDTGAGAAVWRGVQTFCQNFNYTAQQYAAVSEGTEAAEAALSNAAQSGASLVVCYGSDMAAALYYLQDNYPTVSYLMVDGEPHAEDYTNYRTASNVHCVLFREEQAAYLAGYAAVREGNTSMAVLGGEQLPAAVRYATGFVQGAEAAAESMGVQVYIRIWYSNLAQSSDELTEYVHGWYDEGFQVVMAATPELADSCIQAAEATGREVIASGWDCTAQSGTVMTSAVERCSTMVQKDLYAYLSAGKWEQAYSGVTATVGAESEAIGLPMQDWRFSVFTGSEYQNLYAELAEGTVKVERCSDMSALPQTQNVTVDYAGS